MDHLAHKIMVAFICLVVFDATSFTIEKQKFGILGSVLNTTKTIHSAYKTFK